MEGYEVSGYTICKATDKGFYVIPPYHQSQFEDRSIVCAGTLDECLVYVQSKFEEQPREPA